MLMDIKLEASVMTIDGEPVGENAYIGQNGCSIAVVHAGSYFGTDKQLREIALKNAEYLCNLHNKAIKG